MIKESKRLLMENIAEEISKKPIHGDNGDYIITAEGSVNNVSGIFRRKKSEFCQRVY